MIIFSDSDTVLNSQSVQFGPRSPDFVGAGPLGPQSAVTVGPVKIPIITTTVGDLELYKYSCTSTTGTPVITRPKIIQ